MLQLETKITLDDNVMKASNLTHRFSDQDLHRLGSWLDNGYLVDVGSRLKWSLRMQAALDLAQQVVKNKTFPWPGAANVAFPLVTIAAMQFHARAYPAIVSGDDLVKYRISGGPPNEDEIAQAEGMCDIMNTQLLDDDCCWEEQEDRTLLVTSIVGTVFKKTYHVPDGQTNRSEMVMPQDLVLDYAAKSVEACPRKTHVIPMYRNEIYEKVQLKLWRDILEEPWYKGLPAHASQSMEQAHKENRQGGIPPLPDETTPFIFHEQHCWIDFDGDGYAEPYIITYERDSKCVVRIVARWDRKEDIDRTASGKIIRIRATEYFTKRGFIPAPDGGIMDIGFGVLLGPLNESVSTIVNQLLDAGTMATAGGGFLGRGAKIRGGAITFAPNQWRTVDATGDDLKKSILPLPVKEPSSVLFQLLGLLIEYSNRISSATDMMVGENPGQNTPAQTSQTMVEQGMKIYSAIFKRQWRGLKAEFKKLYKLNAVFLPLAKAQFFLGDPSRVIPIADPHVTSETQRLQQAIALKQSAATTSGYNVELVEKKFLKALRVEDIDQVYPGVGDPKKQPGKVPPLPNPKVQVEQMKMQIAQMKLQQDMKQFILTMQSQAMKVKAEILELQARAAKEMAEAKGVQAGHMIEAINTQLAFMKAHDESLRGHIELAMRSMENAGSQDTAGAGISSMAPSPGDASSSPLLAAGAGAS